jgi:predicted N-acetyltransferase YhbS
MQIRSMTFADLDFAAECTIREGWYSQTREVFEGFFKRDPYGCFVAEIDGKQIGIGVATSYGSSGFIGELIVEATLRGQGIGRQLLDNAIRYLQNKGCRSIYLDGVSMATPLYERAGFRKICRSLRFAGSPLPTTIMSQVRPITPADWPVILQMDVQAFGADRSYFLRWQSSLYPGLSKVLIENDTIKGYISAKQRQGGATVGPWVVLPDARYPEDLLISLVQENHIEDINLGVLETNSTAVETIRKLGITESSNPPWRMVFGEPGRLGDSEPCYAIGSPAKG